jgi:hypothetical protein
MHASNPFDAAPEADASEAEGSDDGSRRYMSARARRAKELGLTEAEAEEAEREAEAWARRVNSC